MVLNLTTIDHLLNLLLALPSLQVVTSALNRVILQMPEDSQRYPAANGINNGFKVKPSS